MERYKRVSLIKERISQDWTVSNNSFRVVTENYLCLTLLYRWHSRRIWITVNAQLQEGHCGGSSRVKRYWWVRRVWPMRSLLRITASLRLRWLNLQYPKEGLTKCSLLDIHPSHLACVNLWQWLAKFDKEPSSAFAATSACSLPLDTDMAWYPTQGDSFSELTSWM